MASTEGPDESEMGRIPPQNIEAEMAVLGSMLLEGEAAGLALEKLQPSDFYRKAHQLIFETLEMICDAGDIPDQLTLADLCKGSDILETVGGVEYLHTLATAVPSAANIERYAEIVLACSIKRSIINGSTANLREAEQAGDVTELLDRCEARIFEVAQRRMKAGPELIDALARERVQSAIDSDGPPLGLPTHLPGLNDLTGGLQKPDFIIIAARPSVGKTALLLSFLYHISHVMGKPSLLFTLEMSREQIADRFLCAACRIPFERLRRRALTASQVRRAREFAGTRNIYVDDSSRLSISEIRSKARRMKSKHEIEIIVIDYLQLVDAPKQKSREREVALISSALKTLGKELNVPIIGVAQLNRGVEEHGQGEPQLWQLRSSGALEQDADTVLLLNRKRDREGEYTANAMLRVAKQRNGPVGKVPLVYMAEYMTFAQELDRKAMEI